MSKPWKASQEVHDLLDAVKTRNHLPRLQLATIVAEFKDGKPFPKNRFNWGSVSKFGSKLWLSGDFTFRLTICAGVWHEVLNDVQRESYLDLLIQRCEPVYIPQTVEENGKKIVVKDDFGRIQYTDEIKYDDDGEPKWQIVPMDLIVMTKNVQRYGLWMENLIEFAKVVANC